MCFFVIVQSYSEFPQENKHTFLDNYFPTHINLDALMFQSAG